MAQIPLFGHQGIRKTLVEAARRGTLPGSLLFAGARGVGKQRLALWLGQWLLCESPADEPCGRCRSCRFVTELTHPDLHWFFPRPRLKDADASADDVRQDYAEAIAERAKDHGLYETPSGSEGLYVSTVRAIVQRASISPAIGKRKVFVVGDAERMVSQEGSDQAANAFLKLLEEPPADTTVILTSSEPGALLPTIRSRVVTVRVGAVDAADVRAFLAHEAVVARLKGEDAIGTTVDDRVAFASGAPGRLLSGAGWQVAMENARRLLAAATGQPAARYEAAWSQASSKARGAFADTLDALTVALNERARDAVRRGSDRAALGASKAMEAVEEAKERVTGNISPQLITAHLLRELQEHLT